MMAKSFDEIPPGCGFGCYAGSDDHEELAEVPTLVACSASEASASVVSVADSVTGRYTNIEDKYALDRGRVVGEGWRSSVSECVDRATGKRYAVKTVTKSDPAIKLTDLHREVRLLAEARHDGLVRLVDVFEDADRLHIVTDLYTGGELYSKICERKQSSATRCFPEAEAAGVLRQILHAVQYLHDRDVVHRDLKPENIVYESTDEDSPVKIVDFGLARKHYRNSFEPYMSTVVGTPYFIAPEVLSQKYDRSCDVWSIGIIAYVLLCGYPPFKGSSNREIAAAVRAGKLQFHPKYWQDVSKEAKDFVSKLLRANPKRRMTIEQALNHPWMVMHSQGAAVHSAKEAMEERDDASPCVAVAPGKKLRREGSLLPSFRRSNGQRSLRLSMFRL